MTVVKIIYKFVKVCKSFLTKNLIKKRFRNILTMLIEENNIINNLEMSLKVIRCYDWLLDLYVLVSTDYQFHHMFAINSSILFLFRVFYICKSWTGGTLGKILLFCPKFLKRFIIFSNWFSQ